MLKCLHDQTLCKFQQKYLIFNYFYIIKYFFKKYEIYWKDINTLDFNCFKFDELARGRALPLLLNYIFYNQNLYSKTGIQEKKLLNFANKIQEGYRDNPYHNRIHAFDVCQVKNTINFN